MSRSASASRVRADRFKRVAWLVSALTATNSRSLLNRGVSSSLLSDRLTVHQHVIVSEPSARIHSPAQLPNDRVPIALTDLVTGHELGPTGGFRSGPAKWL